MDGQEGRKQASRLLARTTSTIILKKLGALAPWRGAEMRGCPQKIQTNQLFENLAS